MMSDKRTPDGRVPFKRKNSLLLWYKIVARVLETVCTVGARFD